MVATSSARWANAQRAETASARFDRGTEVQPPHQSQRASESPGIRWASTMYACHVLSAASPVPDDGRNPRVPGGVQSSRRRSRGGHLGIADSLSGPARRTHQMQRDRHGAEGRRWVLKGLAPPTEHGPCRLSGLPAPSSPDMEDKRHAGVVQR